MTMILHLNRTTEHWEYHSADGAVLVTFAYEREAGEYRTERGESLGRKWDEARANALAIARVREKRKIR